jgi:hypothetical protein
MKRFMCIFFAVIMCLGFAGGITGCKEEGSSPPVQTEKIRPQVEKPIPPSETPILPAERPPLGEQKGGGDVSK